MGEGRTVGMDVRVGVGGNQITVGVNVAVWVGVSVDVAAIGVVARQAERQNARIKISTGIIAIIFRLTGVPLSYAGFITTWSRSGPTEIILTGTPAISSTL